MPFWYFFFHRIGPSACFREHQYHHRDDPNLVTPDCTLVRQECDFVIEREMHGLWSPTQGSGSWTQGVCYRASLWFDNQCKGKNVRNICNFGLGDLTRAKKKRCLIGNKFSTSVDTSAILCQVKEILELTRNYVPGIVQNYVF